ncbi:protein kinase [Fusarium oxysporum f. sp. phaseoli]
MQESHESLSLHSPLTDHVYPTSHVPPRRKSVTFSDDTYEPADAGTTVENTRPSSPTSADTQTSIPHAISKERSGETCDSTNSPTKTLGDLIRKELLELDDEHFKQFLPRDRLNDILTEDRIKRTLEEEGRLPKERLQDILQEILSPSISDQNAELYLRSRKEILAILSLIDRVSAIERFIEEDICDYDLPFRYVRETEPHSSDQRLWVMKTSDIERDPRTISLFSEWRDSQAESFKDQQWRIHVPVFSASREGTREPTHYSLARKTITPYLSCTPVGKGGFSVVNKVEIHHGHIDPKGSKTVFAIKRLETSTKSMFEKEVSALSRFADKEHPHLIRLLWTFSLGSTYHLVFPCADGNLMDLWNEHKSPLASKKDHGNAVWFSRQCLGIVEGLKMIHQDTDHDSDEPKRHGRHGDLKPENILWFRDFNSSKEGYSLGTLKISDFGLARFHGTNSKSRINTEGVGGSPTYRAPEYDVHNEVSQSYDIWSLACVLLEFVTWYLKGWEEVENFSRSRKNEDRNSVVGEDIFFNCKQTKTTISANAKISVADEVQSLYEHPNGSDFTLELVQLIQTKLLRMHPDARNKCCDAYEELKKLFDDCCRYPDYCLKRIKAPPARRNTESSLLGPVELPRPRPRSLGEDIPPQFATRLGSGPLTPRSRPGSPALPKSSYIREETLVEESNSQAEESISNNEVPDILPRAATLSLEKPMVDITKHIYDSINHKDDTQMQATKTTRTPIESKITAVDKSREKGEAQGEQRLKGPKRQPDETSSQSGSNIEPNLGETQEEGLVKSPLGRFKTWRRKVMAIICCHR